MQATKRRASPATEHQKPAFTVTRIIKGFEFGHGQISGLASNNEVLELVDWTIHNQPELLVPIDKDDEGHIIKDDGCGDGRAVLTVFSLDHVYKRSLNRSKVFGGSATMTTACLIGLGQAGNRPLNQVFATAINTLGQKGLDYGAHTDEHMHGKNCGCGAIDKAPQILFASLKYEIPIRGVITMLSNYVSGLNDVYGNYRQYVQHLAGHPEYSGMEVMDLIISNSRIVKQLGGTHRECRIVLNTIPGYTVNQKLIRDATQDEAQVFAVDVWRMQDIANKLYVGQPELQHQAFISELIYTVATAAVLTKGDLPVDVITRK